MRILLCTTLFPNEVSASHGIFVENRLRAYREKYDADIKVIAPAPWFPFRHSVFGHYAEFAKIPDREIRDSIEVIHPRYFLPPKVGMNYAPAALAKAFEKTAQELIANGWDFDLIDAHYFYPDGVAANQLAKRLGKPIVITARGTDVNLIPTYSIPRAKILQTALDADAIITVADALKRELQQIGTPAQKITTLRNGVDLERFSPRDRETARQEFGVSGDVIASVGHLIDRKGHDLVIEALAELPGVTLLIAGDGEERRALETLARSIGVSNRVKFLGRLDHVALARVYSAADALILASSREGWPNVLLEAMACGCPCVATDVWGSGEVIRAPEAGCLVKERTGSAIASEVKALLGARPERTATRAYAEAHSWDATADGMHKIFLQLKQTAEAKERAICTPIAFGQNPPRLIVTVDTEEIFDWASFSEINFSLAPTVDIERFQSVCEHHGTKPLYFLTQPLLDDPETVAFFRKLVEMGAAHCGLHLHSWVNDPQSDHVGEYFSFQKNLPADLHHKKLAHLAAVFENAFGQRATSHRAGRYGIAVENYETLAVAGVEFDFSPSAGFDFARKGGPNFSAMSNKPFKIGTTNGDVFVTPVCGAKALPRTRVFLSQEKHGCGFAPPPRSTIRTVPMRLSPEGASLKDLQALTKRLVNDQTPVLTFTLHSTSLTIGANDYGKNLAAINDLISTTDQYLTWFNNDVGGEIIDLNSLAAEFKR